MGMAVMLAEMARSSGVVDMFRDGECSRCGGCCGRVIPLTEEDADRLRAYVGSHGVRPNRDAGSCPFLSGDGCMVYEARPIMCRLYTCRGHLTGEMADDPRNMLFGSAVCVDMQEFAFGKGGICADAS